MYRSKGLIFLALALLCVLGMGTGARAATYYWHGTDDLPYTTGSLWTDTPGTGGNALTDGQFWSLLQDAGLGATFTMPADVNDILINGDPGTAVFNAPFIFTSPDANDNAHGFKIKRENSEGTAAATYTFNDMSFQGTLNCGDTDRSFNVAGNWKLTGPFVIMARGYNGGVVVNIPAFIDGSRIDTYVCQWRTGSSSTPGNNGSNMHLTNGNNAFFGEWKLSTQFIVDTAGALGDADVTVLGACDYRTNPPADMNIAEWKSGKNAGILRLSASDAISPTAKLTLARSTSTVDSANHGKLILDAGVNATVRQLVLDGTTLPAGTYSAANYPGRIEGTGTITTTDQAATAILTMACTKGAGGPAMTGDTCLMPRQGAAKAYVVNYAARIRAESTLSIAGTNYTFAGWLSSTTPSGIANASSTDTTVTMDVSRTVTAVYSQNPGATAPNPALNTGNVSIMTGLSWTADPCATTSQDVYFGTSAASMTLKASLNATATSVTNATIGGPLAEEKEYYWRIRTDGSDGPAWRFVTGKTKATTPSPADNATGQSTSPTLTWVSPDAGATSFDVYFSTDRAAVENGQVTPSNVATPSLGKSGLSAGYTYYWRADVKFGTSKVTYGDVWAFRTTGIAVTIDTDAGTVSGTPPFTYTAAPDDAGVMVFEVSNFNYGQQYDVSVVGSRRLAIWSSGNINFGGILDASAPTQSGAGRGLAVAGGYVGGEAMCVRAPNTGDPNFPSYRWYPPTTTTTRYAWITGDMSFWRRRESILRNDPNWLPRQDDTVFGPGRPYAQCTSGNISTPDQPLPTSPKIVSNLNQYGMGAAYGGGGGIHASYNVGHSDWDVQMGAPQQYSSYPASATLGAAVPGTYGEREVYELWGGSGGSGSSAGSMGTITTPHPRARGGGGGGGAVEIYSLYGSLTLGASAQIKANGGSVINDGTRYTGTAINPTGNDSPYPGGGGSGGSIRLIAKTNLALAGTVSAQGGAGASAPEWKITSSPTTGGGGGGRIALYKGGNVANSGTISAAGGEGGTYSAPAQQAQVQYRINGGVGTVYGLQSGNGMLSMLTVPHDAIPQDGVGLTDANNVTVKWRPALGTTTMELYLGTATTPPLVQTYPSGTLMRAQRSYLVGATVPQGTTYYWQVKCNGVMGPLWSFKVLSYEARNPNPATGATAVEPNQPPLSWSAGDALTATKWGVYFGTDKTAVTNATTSTPNIYLGTVTTPQKTAALLKASTTYYWRIDEYNTKPGSPFKGLTWNFTTRAPIVSFGYADLNSDGRVTFVDFAILAADWKKCNLYSGCP